MSTVREACYAQEEHVELAQCYDAESGNSRTAFEISECIGEGEARNNDDLGGQALQSTLKDDRKSMQFEMSDGRHKMFRRYLRFKDKMLERSPFELSPISGIQPTASETNTSPGTTSSIATENLCDPCFRRLCSGSFVPRNRGIRETSRVLQMGYITTLAQNRPSGTFGCFICQTIVLSIEEAKILAAKREAVGAKREVELDLGPSDFSESEPLVAWINLKGNDTCLESLQIELCAQNGAWILSEEFVMLAPLGSPARNYLGSRGFCKDVMAHESFELIKLWLHECRELHALCSSFGKERIPKRILDLFLCESSQIVQFRRNDAPPGDYVALSYCWGGPQSLYLNGGMSQQYFDNGIPLHKLPKTIRDAIRVTIALGVRYLWIDSLCIIQDSEEDKREQLSQMGDIFRNAYFTICAASAATVETGFLGKRYSKTFGEHELLLRPCEQTEIGPVKLIQVEDVPKISPERNPTELRGWTFQEKLLSTRTLYYTATHLEWRCTTTSLLPEDSESAKMQRKLNLPTKGNNESIINHWADITMEYSKRSLTEPRDVLRALAAVASEFQPVFDSIYLAGLWSSSIKGWLMWYRYGHTPGWDPDQPDENFQYRHTIYVAPSWSWASIREPISYKLASHDFPSDTDSPILQICSQDIHLADENTPFADISHGSLTLRGQSKRMWLHNGRILSPAELYETGDAVAVVYPDSRETVETRALLVTCLKITETAGLVLRSVTDLRYPPAQENVYCERIGLFDASLLSRCEWLSYWEDNTLTIT